jgi:hypothetical protein
MKTDDMSEDDETQEMMGELSIVQKIRADNVRFDMQHLYYSLSVLRKTFNQLGDGAVIRFITVRQCMIMMN